MKKTDNAHIEDKLVLRKYFLNKYTHPSFSVIDCCAGSGHIWNVLRSEYTCKYWGMDVKSQNGRLRVKSERVLSSGAIADVIDIDTYGSPWKHWFNVLPFIDQEVIIFLTIGSTHTGNQQKEALHHSHLEFSTMKCPPTLSAKMRQYITDCCISKVREYGLFINEGQRIKHSRVEYIGLYIKKQKKT